MTSDPPPARGRPQDDELTAHILAEARLQLDLHGYDDLRIERIAAAVGCGKSAIYRRWPNLAALVAATMNDAASVGTIPDTGSVVEDLLLHVQRNIDNGTTRRSDSAFSALVTPAVRDALWNDGFLSRRRRMGRQVLARAVERGELPEQTDADAILDVLAGFVFYRRTVRLADISSAEFRALIESLTASPPLRP